MHELHSQYHNFLMSKFVATYLILSFCHFCVNLILLVLTCTIPCANMVHVYVCIHTDPQMSVGASYVELSLHPRPIQIVLAKPDHTFELDLEALREILLSDDVKDRKVMVLSVAGAFRKGKSFLLDYLLRFLNYGVSSCMVLVR